MGQWVKNLDLESKIFFSSDIFQEALLRFLCQLSATRSSLSINQWAGKQICLNVSKYFFFTFFFDSCCYFMLFFHWLLFGEKKAIPWDGWVFNVAIVNLFTIKFLLDT